MPLSAENISLICPCNDLESQTILDIAQRLGLDVHQIDGGWGITLDTALNQIADLTKLHEHVITIELPGANGLATLQQLGKQVHVIDHHKYSAKDDFISLPSSLEQFATLLDYDLTEEEYQIAINDRDFLPGLSKAGVSLEQAQSLRQQELALRGKVDAMQAAKAFVTEHKRELYDLRLVLAPEEYAGVMLEAAQWPTDKVYTEAANTRKPVSLKPTLILYHCAEQREVICQIEYAGPAKHRQALADLFANWQHEFKLWLGGGQHSCFFGAKLKNPFADVDGLVSQLLNISLHLGRPLRHYGCTFYLPLDLFLESDLVKNRPLPLSVRKTFKQHYLDTETPILKEDLDLVKGREKQAYLYFLPHLQQMIFDVKGAKNDLNIEPIRHWRLHEPMTMELGNGEAVVELTDVSLYSYFNHTYLLAFSVQPAIKLDTEKPSLHRDGTDWWHDLFFKDDDEFQQIAGLQLHHWLRFTNQARIVYPSFVEQVFEGKITLVTLKTAKESVEFKYQDEISPIVLFLLKRFFDNADDSKLKDRLQYLPDDRMMVSPAYGLAGQPLKPDDSKRLFSLALYVDTESATFDKLDGYAYDPQFVDTLLEKDSLARWFGVGTYSGYCSHANAYFGFCWFFNNVIAPSHVPYIYGRMLILGLFYQMALRHYNRRINYATKRLSEKKTSSEFQDLRKEFIRFTNTYWFREVTNQVQGIEVFELQTKALGLDAEYALIKDEMERADEYSGALRSEKMNLRVLFFTIVAAMAATAALPPILQWVLGKIQWVGEVIYRFF